jgi:hypothetical protein
LFNGGFFAQERKMNPDKINQGGAQNQENQPPEQTGSFKPPKQRRHSNDSGRTQVSENDSLHDNKDRLPGVSSER